MNQSETCFPRDPYMCPLRFGDDVFALESQFLPLKDNSEIQQVGVLKAIWLQFRSPSSPVPEYVGCHFVWLFPCADLAVDQFALVRTISVKLLIVLPDKQQDQGNWSFCIPYEQKRRTASTSFRPHIVEDHKIHLVRHIHVTW